MERLRQVRAERDGLQVQKALGEIRMAAEKGENIIPSLVGAVKVYATIGEVMGTLRGVFGEFRQPSDTF